MIAEQFEHVGVIRKNPNVLSGHWMCDGRLGNEFSIPHFAHIEILQKALVFET